MGREMETELPLHLKFETETKYYHAILCRDLFGNWVILRYWGGKSSRLGSSQTDFCESYAEAIKKLQELQNVRKYRGYTELS